jgi:hypothetical protein
MENKKSTLGIFQDCAADGCEANFAGCQQVIDKVEIPALKESISNRVVTKIQQALGA